MTTPPAFYKMPQFEGQPVRYAEGDYYVHRCWPRQRGGRPYWQVRFAFGPRDAKTRGAIGVHNFARRADAKAEADRLNRTPKEAL